MPDANGQATEDEIHAATARLLALNFPQFPAETVREHGVYWTTHEIRNAKNSVEGANRKRRGVRAGNPDLLFIRDGRTYSIELKTATGALSHPQIEERERIVAAGGSWALCRSDIDVLRTLSQWGFPLRARVFA